VLRRHFFLLVAAVVLAGLPPAVSSAAGQLEVVFLDAGHGDTVVYRGPCGEVGIVDVNRGGDDEVLAQLDAWGARDDVRWMSVSHYDADHLGGVVDVATAVSGLTAVYDRGGDRTVKDTLTYRGYYDWVTGAGLRQPVEIGDRFDLCGTVEFDVVSVGTDGTAAGGVPVSEENDRGVCVAVSYGTFDLASCGDVNAPVEVGVAAAYGPVEVAKVSHHG
jgi:beta-lactamase superfamily II metal-dependent hydrolase